MKKSHLLGACLTLVAVSAAAQPGFMPKSPGSFVSATGAPPTLDAATTQTLSISLGGITPTATPTLQYKPSAGGSWTQALPMYQSDNAGSPPWAGMVVGLTAETSYDVRVMVDGVEHPLTASTRAVPVVMTEGAATRVVNVSDMTALQAAVNDSAPGDLILMAAGTYSGRLTIQNENGTAVAPITIRGASGHTSILDAGGDYGVFISNSNYIHVEGLKIQNASVGVEIRDWIGLDGTIGNTIRDNWITSVGKGVFAKCNDNAQDHDDLYVVNNVIEGGVVFPDTASTTWDYEGIVICSVGAEVAYNTMSGFGDSLGLSQNTQNRGIDIHHNLVLWGGDDGVEMDFSDRNTAVHHNLISNTANGISFQYVDDGPSYAYRNIVYNYLRGPYKIKAEADDNDGVFLINNTTIGGGDPATAYLGWPWLNSQAYNTDGVWVVNNLFVGNSNAPDVIRLDTSFFTNVTWKNNAYNFDDSFQFGTIANETNFANWIANSVANFGYAVNDVLLEGETIFANVTLDWETNDFKTYRDPLAVGLDFRPHSASSAIDAGLAFPGVTDGVASPDIGALESGVAIPAYGADWTP